MLKRLMIATAIGALFAGQAAADTTLRLTEVITSPERTKTLRKIVDNFEKENAGVKVEITSLPWGQAFEKFATMVSAGNTPDVVEMPDRWQSLYASSGRLEDLGPYLDKWDETKKINNLTMKMAKVVGDKAYSLPYGFYLRALFYNKKLFKQAGIDGPPKTLTEFKQDAEKISKLPGKYGYCLRGGPGGYGGWLMLGASMAKSGDFFHKDGTSTLADSGWVDGYQFLIDLYKNGNAPKDSVNWGFNEVVAGFYSGTCAMLDQDPDALIGIADRMDSEDYGVAPFPTGPGGNRYPTLGYAGWAMFANSDHKDLAWKLIAALDGPKGNLMWNKQTGTLPIYNSLKSDPFYQKQGYKAWFEELASDKTKPLVFPFRLKEFGFFSDSLVPKTSQKALLGDITAKELGEQWAAFMTKANKASETSAN
ncbi:ABC transporter substrate-binding protein [Pararhizobium mangrovi]|uniref:Sugar ABC transporter substrate-binding protein n=1 Tax=Pararhizobium mangrovi TaxID=2590452 RepID=A0A506U3Q6_9HYPH|nr:sugar ABC transporter substrate-binding protein [Pararhizobium mangrovi]TPW29023.1 sugar ABC transporter substrate-binding protein [Pararhizobium mangrovi]